MEQLKSWVRKVWDVAGAKAREFGAWVSTIGAWCGRHRILTILFGGIAFVLFWSWLVGGWWLLTDGPRQALDAYTKLDPKDKVEAFGKLATALGLLVAAPFALLGVGLAVWRTWNQHRDGELAARKLDAEAFAKAVEQLGHAEIAIRMGAVLALQNLAEASPRRLLGQTLEILCAYVREKRPRTKEKDEHPAVPLDTDIKLILQVISRLNQQNAYGKIPVDLRKTDLRGADLSGVYLQRVDFSGTNLADAEFIAADLQRARFPDASLQRAFLLDANLQVTMLRDTNLQSACLMTANLQGAFLWGADLQHANLLRANLQDTIMDGANLNGATLTGTILEKKDEAKG